MNYRNWFRSCFCLLFTRSTSFSIILLSVLLVESISSLYPLSFLWVAAIWDGGRPYGNIDGLCCFVGNQLKCRRDETTALAESGIAVTVGVCLSHVPVWNHWERRTGWHVWDIQEGACKQKDKNRYLRAWGPRLCPFCWKPEQDYRGWDEPSQFPDVLCYVVPAGVTSHFQDAFSQIPVHSVSEKYPANPEEFYRR